MKVWPERGEAYETAVPDNTQQDLVKRLREHDVAIDVEEAGGSWWTTVLIVAAPVVL